MRVVRRGGRLTVSIGDVVVDGHIGALRTLASEIVVAAAGRRVLGHRTVWRPAADVHWKRPDAFIQLAEACLARGRVHDARDLAHLAIVETLYMEDVDEGSKPAPPPAVLALVARRRSPLDGARGAHLTVVKKLLASLVRADRARVVPLLRAITEVVADAAYASPLALSALVAGPALAMARHEDARGEAALDLVETLAGKMMLSAAYAEALPLADALVEAGVSLPGSLVDRFTARAALADPRAEDDRRALEGFARAHRERLRPKVAELAPWAALALAHVRAGQALEMRARGGDACLERPKKAITPLAEGEAARLSARAREHVEAARRLLGESLVADRESDAFDASQRRKQIHEDFHALDGALHRAAGDSKAAWDAYQRAHDAAQRDAYDHRKNDHLPALRALAKKLGIAPPAAGKVRR